MLCRFDARGIGRTRRQPAAPMTAYLELHFWGHSVQRKIINLHKKMFMVSMAILIYHEYAFFCSKYKGPFYLWKWPAKPQSAAWTQHSIDLVPLSSLEHNQDPVPKLSGTPAGKNEWINFSYFHSYLFPQHNQNTILCHSKYKHTLSF